MKPPVFSINGFPSPGGKIGSMQTTRFSRFSCLAALGAGALLLPLAGCEEGSISDSTPYNGSAYVGGRGHEIDELDLLGAHGGPVSEGDIQDALRHERSGSGVRAWPGSSLLVVQSGAVAPDSIMLGDLERSYRVFPFSGVSAESHRDGSLGRELRLAAARSGCTHILCYWGKLESIHEDQVTKTVSWVPIVGSLVPDEERTTRLRVRAVLLDVASGRSATFTPPAAQNSALSPSLLRGSSADKQVYDLKTSAYAGLVARLTGQNG